MNEKEMKRIIEAELNKLIILEKQIAEIQVQLKILQELINELKPKQ
jgi:glycerol-3-phosphate responsive antiterminator